MLWRARQSVWYLMIRWDMPNSSPEATSRYRPRHAALSLTLLVALAMLMGLTQQAHAGLRVPPVGPNPLVVPPVVSVPVRQPARELSTPTDQLLVEYATPQWQVASPLRAPEKTLTRMGFQPLRTVATPRRPMMQVLQIPAGVAPAQALQQVAAQPGVAFVAPNRRYRVSADASRLAHPFTPAAGVPPASTWTGASTNDEYARYLWGLGNTSDIDIDFREAYARQRGLRRVKVAVLDTGVDINHPDLRTAIWTNSVEAAGQPGVDDDNNGCVDDVHGCNMLRHNGQVYVDATEDLHGTHVAGTIAATAGNGLGITGVAPGISLVPGKMIGSDGGTTADAIAGIRYAKRIGVSVINASWGGYDSDPALQRELASCGMLVVAAAGNDGIDIDTMPYYPASFELPNLISVAALGRDGYLAEWSNYGRLRADVAAPGVDILSTGPANQYYVEDGTSMATPHVSAVAALNASRYSSWTPAGGVSALLRAVKRRTSLRGEVATSGVINAAMAVGARPIATVTGQWSAALLRVGWVNPTDAGFTSTMVRVGRGTGIPTVTTGAGVYSGTGTAAVLPRLRPGFDYTVAVYATDGWGVRSPALLRVWGTAISRSATPTSLGMRLRVLSTGRVLPGRQVRLVRYLASGPRVLCTRTTSATGRASCPTSRGRLEWQAPSSGTYLLGSTSAFTR